MQYYRPWTRLPPFIPYARFLLSPSLSETARLVYSLILSRIHWSQSNGWVDAEGRIYCRYTLQNLMSDTRKANPPLLPHWQIWKNKVCFPASGAAPGMPTGCT